MAKLHFPLNKWWARVLAGAAALIILSVALSYFISSDYLRRYMERRMNGYLKGYTVHIERAYLHPVAFSLDLDGLTLTQDANPDPPVAYIRRLHAGVHWRELLSARLVGDFLIDHPAIYANLKNIRKEEESKVPFKKKGWQEALESIYPLKINVFRVSDGELTYVDEGPYKPLHASKLNLYASNIRNIHYPEKVYPSPFYVRGTIFDKGILTLVGQANFLEEPHMGFKAVLDLADMDLGYFEPILNRGNFSVRRGTLSAKGHLEYNPRLTDVNLKNLDIRGAYIDYLHLSRTVTAEQERIAKAAQTAKKLSNEPASRIRADILRIADSSFGYVNRAANPNYRVFIDHAEMTLKNFSNQFVEGPATLRLSGKFMGTGDTLVTGVFRPETKNPDFNINIAIENTQMPAMSDLFRSFGNFDIKAGLFSFYSELTVKGDTINGYVKPLFKGMQVYDRRAYSEKSLFHKLYVGLVGGVAKLLENRPRKEVATKTTISGPVGSPRSSTWQIIFNLIRNAFIRSILPGFEEEVSKKKTISQPSVPDRSAIVEPEPSK